MIDKNVCTYNAYCNKSDQYIELSIASDDTYAEETKTDKCFSKRRLLFTGGALLLVSLCQVDTNILDARKITLVSYEESSALSKALFPTMAGPVTKHKVYASLRSRLGNCMFILASLYGLARKFNHRPIFVNGRANFTLGFFKWVFPNLPIQEFSRSLAAFRNTTKNAVSVYYDRRDTKKIRFQPITYLPDKDVLLCCYLQYYPHFANYAAEVKTIFEMHPLLKKRAHKFLVDCMRKEAERLGLPKETNFTLVSIHVRRGDRVIIGYHNRGYSVPGMDYFKQAMEYFKNRYINPLFIVCTDEVQWVQENFKIPPVYISPFIRAEQDMAILVACDHIITSVGTFSWWAAFLNKGEKIFFKYKPTTGIYKNNITAFGFQFPAADWVGITAPKTNVGKH